MENETSLVPIKSQAEQLSKSLTGLVIKNATDMNIAVERLGEVKSFLKIVEAKKKSVMESINFLLVPIKSLSDKFKKEEEDLRNKINAYQTTQVAKAEVKIDKIQEKVESGKMSFYKGVEKIENLAPAKKIETEKNAVQFIDHKSVEVEDETKIPREYLIVDMVKLRKVVLAGVAVPGAKIVITQSIRNTTLGNAQNAPRSEWAKQN